MLLQFSVENFRSFKERAVLSMEASKDTVHPDHVVTMGKERLLKTAAIFGANASGKSNLFKAMAAALEIIRESDSRQISEPIRQIVPFKFSNETVNKPSSFEFVFITEQKKYVYGFSATKERVEEEYLYVYNSSRPSTIFERDCRNTPEYTFTNAKNRKELEPIVERNRSNKLFLSTATAWNAKVTEIPLVWFEQIGVYQNNYERFIDHDISLLEKDDKALKEFICRVLGEADINIQDYEYKSDINALKGVLQKFPPQIRSSLRQDVLSRENPFVKIYAMHYIKGSENKLEEYKLNLREESKGTRSLFLLSPFLYEAFRSGKTICIDEFDTSLHPLLVAYLIGLFNDPDINQANAQLIVSTHSTILLSRKFIRDDEVYFVDKDNETGESGVYSLDDFSTRKNMDIRKAYLLGRFGAVPEIEGGEIIW